MGPRIREVQQPAKSLKRNLKAFNHLEVALGHCNRAAAQLATPQALVKQLPMCIFCVLTLCIFCVQISIIDLLNIFADHKYNENLTHAQTTSTRPSCSPNRYKSENSAWDRGYLDRCTSSMCNLPDDNISAGPRD